MCGPTLCIVSAKPQSLAFYTSSIRKTTTLLRPCARFVNRHRTFYVAEASPSGAATLETTAMSTQQAPPIPKTSQSAEPKKDQAKPKLAQEGTNLYSMDDDEDTTTIEDVLTA